jgi:hypothetical protein
LEAREVGGWRRRNKTLTYRRELISLDKLGRRPGLTDNEIDPELYPIELEKASSKELEDWNIECCMCECSLDFVTYRKVASPKNLAGCWYPRVARDEFVQGFADGYGLVNRTRHRAWELYIEWLESAWMREDIRYYRKGKK